MDTDTSVKSSPKERGSVIIFLAVLMVLLLGFLGLAVDSGHLFKVRNELQNAADAAALKGARFLYRTPLTPGEKPTLDFPTALAKAKEVINKSDNQDLSDAVVTVGYWNLDWTGDHELQPTTITPTARDVPAVRAIVNRAAGSNGNGGPVANNFLRVLGEENGTTAVGSLPAVAVSGSPGSVASNTLFPLAISDCMIQHYFSQDPLPQPPPQINISSAYLPGGAGCYTGQWTSFETDVDVSSSAGTSYIESLFSTGNVDPLAVGDAILMDPGARAALYSPKLTNWLPEGGKDVILAVVQSAGSDFTSKTSLPITGFATFHIDGAVGGNDRYVYGHFINYFTTPPGVRPGGVTSNTVTLPILVQ